MVHSRSILGVLASIWTFASIAHAQRILPRSSFGVRGQRISPDGHNIPGWLLSGDGYSPEILSDRVVLTPSHPGNKRGSLWAVDPLDEPEWNLEFQFRTNGEDRGNGNLQLWFVKNGQFEIGPSSIYTVGSFDGFALVVDSHSGSGSIRGFLNDNSVRYNSHPSVDSLAFGHCQYPYRNLGRPSNVRVTHSKQGLEVAVDGRTCFQTPKVQLPVGYNVGITAGSAEIPDSFEILTFSLQTLGSFATPNTAGSSAAGSAVSADSRIDGIYDTTKGLSSTINRVSVELDAYARRTEDAFRSSAKTDHLLIIDKRLHEIERQLADLANNMRERDCSGQINGLRAALRDSHSGVMEHLQISSNKIITSAPSLGVFIVLVIAVQLALAASYVYYKKRRQSMPKKFL